MLRTGPPAAPGHAASPYMRQCDGNGHAALFFSRALFRASTAVPVQAADWRRDMARRQATCELRGAATDLGEDLVKVQRRSRVIEVTARRSSSSDAANARMAATSRMPARPALDPACAGSGPERRRQAKSTVPRKVPEGGCFSSKAPACFLDPDDDETRPARSRARGIGLAPLSAGRGLDGHEPGCGSPARMTGLTRVASSASCAPRQRGRPLATTWMHRTSLTGTSTFMSATLTLRATRAPGRRCAQCSSGSVRDAKTPDVAQAERCRKEHPEVLRG